MTLRLVPLSLVIVALSASAGRAALVYVSDLSGLAAEVEFTLTSPTTLEVRVKNTSSGVPDGFDSSDQLLTGVSWDFGDGTQIVGGAVVVGPTSTAASFDVPAGPGDDISGEWGFGNSGALNMFDNLISTLSAQTTSFGGPNLDGSGGLDGPQGGLAADPPLVSLGGLGAVVSEIVATLSLSQPVADLSFLNNGVTVEFGSDAAFITTRIPEPASAGLAAAAVALVASGGAAARRRRKAPPGNCSGPTRLGR